MAEHPTRSLEQEPEEKPAEHHSVEERLKALEEAVATLMKNTVPPDLNR
jgi:hypothetical protein